jgi:phosphoesterase RecJ-like protein
MSVEAMFPQIWSCIKASGSVVLGSHVRMDGDALGSMLALRTLLLDMGKTVRIVHADPVPAQYRCLTGWDSVCMPADVASDETYDLGIVLDSGTIERLGDAADVMRRADTLINIDHHRDWKDFGGINVIDTEAAAVGETLYALFEWADVNVTADMATALYTSLATDTGGFRYANTTAKTHRVAAMLIECGADAATVNRSLYENRALAELRLLGPALATLTQECGGKITWMKVDAQMLEQADAGPEHMEGFVNYPRSVAGTEIAVLFTEIEPGITKASLRSNDEADVSELAGRFGGGGHYRAAGCTIEAHLDQARAMVLDACREMLECKDDG